jgi:hypothetical protein
LAIAATTVLLQFSYWPILMGATGLFLEERSLGPVYLGLALVPFVFLLVAFASRHPRASGAVLRAMGLFIVVALPIGATVGPVLGVPAGFAVGGITALRPPDGFSRVGRARGIAVLAGLVYLTVMAAVAPLFAAFVGAVLPFAVLGLADQALEWRAQEAS